MIKELRWAIRAEIVRKTLGMSGVARLLERARSTELPLILRRYGSAIGEGCVIKGPLFVDNVVGDLTSSSDFSHLTLGKRVYLGKSTSLDLAGCILMEDEVVLSSGCSILSHQDCGDRRMSKYYPRKVADVNIRRGAWVGASAVVLGGVEIGECAVVAAGAVVTKSVRPFTVVGGVPAKVLRELPSA